ncbi:MAG: hypothetical protein EA426_11395 [Spirochaetaceae bacterium]|nr:MAG: hypothetical protein EA426_11395 [Spirochaetaceae bacterium]
MKNHELNDVVSEITAGCAALGRLDAFARSQLAGDIAKLGQNETAAFAVATMLENYYTAAETVFFRISQQFGNSLTPDRWHSDLLRKMRIEMPDVRPAVISETTYSLMDELMRFRHFKRYYYQLQFDWPRLENLLTVRERVHEQLLVELNVFKQFVERVATAD